jgi:hypothetical protein
MRDEALVEAIARVAHEANRAWSAAWGQEVQPAWDEAPEWQVQSTRISITDLLANPSITGRDVHDLWLRQKSDAGWCFGPVKDPGLKTHPSMVPYDDLSDIEKAKDILFRAIVLSLAFRVLNPPGVFDEADQTHFLKDQSLEQKRPH